MKIITVILAIFCAVHINAQNELPPMVKRSIPAKYKITYEMYAKTGFIAQAEVSLTIPAKHSCNDGLKGECEIKVTILSYDSREKDIINQMEQMDPFANKLPSKDNHQPEVNPMDELVTYSETYTVDLPGGRGAYYIATRTCIQDQHDSYQSVSLRSLQGNTANAVAIDVNGGVDPEEAVAIVKELYGILGKIDLHIR